MAYQIDINRVDPTTGTLSLISTGSGAHRASLGTFKQGIRVEMRELVDAAGGLGTVHLALNFSDAAPFPDDHQQPSVFGHWPYKMTMQHQDAKGAIVAAVTVEGAHDCSFVATGDVTVELQDKSSPGSPNQYLAILK